MNPIVGIGELLWDIYPDGRKVAGGAPFNFAFHCHQLGHEAVIVSRVGDDDLGRELREEVKRLGLSDDFIQTDRDHPTGTVTVALDANKVPTYTINENVAWDHIAGSDALAELSTRCAAILFGTLSWRAKRSNEPLDSMLIHHHRHATSPLTIFDLNLRPPFYDSLILELGVSLGNWVKISSDDLGELRRAIPGLPSSLPDLVRAFGGTVFPFWPNPVILYTRGGEGVDICRRDGNLHEPAASANVVDTVGAGDAFTAAMVCLHLEGRPLRDCARFANHYAARVCEHQGATPRIDRAEVERSL